MPIKGAKNKNIILWDVAGSGVAVGATCLVTFTRLPGWPVAPTSPQILCYNTSQILLPFGWTYWARNSLCSKQWKIHCTVGKHRGGWCNILSVLCCMVLALVLVLVWLPSAVDLRRFIHRYLAPTAAGHHHQLGPALPDFGFNGAECGRERGNWKPKQKSEHIFEAERHLRQVLRVVTLVCNWSKQSPHS